ncbi:MAG: hypothetical protein IJI10_03460 [Eubacterium sp.]|nr:hypothetical protein [Eubacterium sp.]
MQRGNGIFAICDTETEYAFRFMEFLSHRKNIMFEIRVFTTVEKLLDFTKENRIEILLISERSMRDEVACLPVGKLIILTETGRTPGYPDCLNIYKYQSSDIVVREIMESYGQDAKAGQPLSVRRRNLQVCGVYSPVPCPQKTLLALALAMELAKSRRVLYLNLESFSGFEQFTGDKYERNLSDLIYLFRQSGKGFPHKLNSMIYSIGNVDYLPPIQTPSDFMEITGEEWIRFFEAVGSASSYDALVLDIGNTIPDVMLLLAYCSRIYFPVGQDAFSEARRKEFETLLDGSDNGMIREKMQTLSPPQIACRETGRRAIEKLPWTELGKYAAAVCAAGA